VADMIPQVYPLFAAYQYMRRLRYGRIIYWSSDNLTSCSTRRDGTVDRPVPADVGAGMASWPRTWPGTAPGHRGPLHAS
jgi:hypothetical protein